MGGALTLITELFRANKKISIPRDNEVSKLPKVRMGVLVKLTES